LGPARYSLAGVDVVRIGRGSQRAARIAPAHVLEISLPDGLVSTAHAEIRKGRDCWMIRDLGSKNGLVVDGENVSTAELGDEAVAQVGRTLFTFRSSVPACGPPYVEAVDLPGSASGLGTLSPAFEDLLFRAKAVAASPVSVLLRGESGVGKEVLARAIHGWSGRRGAFVPVNCGAIARDLVESELFGHQKGAFSGAVGDYRGLVRSADGGTLFRLQNVIEGW
jgi:transcriptional regulator of acetoin/glycerol metabolism